MGSRRLDNEEAPAFYGILCHGKRDNEGMLCVREKGCEDSWMFFGRHRGCMTKNVCDHWFGDFAT
jgi:hypothetical protein